MRTSPIPKPVSRRRFLAYTSLATTGLALGMGKLPRAARTGKVAGMTVAELPKGPAPEPLGFAHFPDRLHAYVWRNWSLVPVPRLARVIGARAAEVRRLGRAMGLGNPPRITRSQQARSYITVIKRNWHLLPYEQLLELLDWSPEQLAETLREDDFLFIKLGNLKPQCAPLRYRPSDAAMLERERELAQIVRETFGEDAGRTPDPLFGFVRRLAQPPPRRTPSRRPSELRFCYSYFALYGDPLLAPAEDPYPEGYLARLAQTGVTGVWLPVMLSQLARVPWEIEPDRSRAIRLRNLRRLVARARRHGVRVFLYLNEPRSQPLKFFERHPHLKGVTEGQYATLCTSVAEVQAFLRESVATICRAVPELGGFFSISASENLTNCWSHGQGAQCPRCAQRAPAAVIAEVNRLFFEGIEAAGSDAQLLVWDWGWNDAWAGDVIRQLPKKVSLMSVSEWRLPIKRGGVASEVGEYSISAVGPGPRATEHWRLARAAGLNTLAKIQAGNTWELSAVPAIPAVANVARHAENLSKAEVSGVMLGWTLGGYPSSNLEVAASALACGSGEAAMHQVARRRFGPQLADAVVQAWQGFSAAFCEFPYHIGVVYSAPLQVGPANLLWAEPTGYRATMTGLPYDDLPAWRSIYPASVFAEQFEKVAAGFERTLAELRAFAARNTGQTSAPQAQAFEAECRVAEAAGIHFQSVANQACFVMARQALATVNKAEDARPLLARLERVLHDEITLARRLYALQSVDSRLGFEASNHYFYVPMDLMEKVINCRALLTGWLAAQRRRFGMDGPAS